MWSWVRRLWPFQYVTDTKKTFQASGSPATSKRSSWWPGHWLRRGSSVAPDDNKQASAEEAPRLVVVHAGGAVLRATSNINSAKVGNLRRGEVVPIVKEAGRRACVQTPEGARAWISTVNTDGEPIVRRVTASTKYKAKDMPIEGTSAFADAFEARWQEKWQRLRVDADRKEARPHSMRSSVPGLPIFAWRPSGKLEAASGGLRARLRRPPRLAPQAVPKLEQPLSARTSVHTGTANSSAGSSSGDVHRGLLSLRENNGELPDLIAFDTWPRANRSSSNVPSLAELLGGPGRPVVTQSSREPSVLDTSLVEEIAAEDFDRSNKEAVVFNTEPSPSVALRLSTKPLFLSAPPRRGVSLVDATNKPMSEIAAGSEIFQYLLKDIEQEDQDQDPAAGDSSPSKAQDSTAPVIGFADGGVDDLTAAEVLLSFPEPTLEAEEENGSTPGFQLDSLAPSRAKRSMRKQPSKYRPNRTVEADLDVENATFLDQHRAAEMDSKEIEVPVESSAEPDESFDEIIGDPVADEPDKAIVSVQIPLRPGDGAGESSRKPSAQAYGLKKGVCEISAASMANLADVPIDPEKPSGTVEAPNTSQDADASLRADVASSPPRSPRGQQPQQAAASPSTETVQASPLSQSSLLELATLTPETSKAQAGNLPDLASIPVFEFPAPASVNTGKDNDSGDTQPQGEYGDGVPDLSQNPLFDANQHGTGVSKQEDLL